MVWDAITLFVGLPLFAFAMVSAARNRLRGCPLLGGMLFYFFYMYLMYAVMVAFNQLFLGGIHMSNIPSFEYARLYGERVVLSVTNNTRDDGIDFLDEVRILNNCIKHGKIVDEDLTNAVCAWIKLDATGARFPSQTPPAHSPPPASYTSYPPTNTTTTQN
jgi:hypothetical protein